MANPSNRAKALGALYDRPANPGGFVTEVCPVGLALVLNMLLDNQDRLEARIAELECLAGVRDRPMVVVERDPETGEYTRQVVTPDFSTTCSVCERRIGPNDYVYMEVREGKEIRWCLNCSPVIFRPVTPDVGL